MNKLERAEWFRVMLIPAAMERHISDAHLRTNGHDVDIVADVGSRRLQLVSSSEMDEWDKSQDQRSETVDRIKLRLNAWQQGSA